MKEPTIKEILLDLTDIAETYKVCESKFSGLEHAKVTKTFLDALILKISFFNVLLGCVDAKKIKEFRNE